MNRVVLSVRRWLGIVFLGLAAGMLVLGEVLLKDRLKGGAFLGYWGGCFLCVMLAMVTAWLDLRALKRQNREAQRDLMEQAWRELGNRPAEPGSGKACPPSADGPGGLNGA